MENPWDPSPGRARSELAILPTETVGFKAWAAQMAAWARSAAAETRTLRAEVENPQDQVRRMERTAKYKTKSETGEAKQRVEVKEDFQTPKKTAFDSLVTATTSGATNQDKGTQTPGSGSRRWRQ